MVLSSTIQYTGLAQKYQESCLNSSEANAPKMADCAIPITFCTQALALLEEGILVLRIIEVTCLSEAPICQVKKNRF